MLNNSPRCPVQACLWAQPPWPCRDGTGSMILKVRPGKASSDEKNLNWAPASFKRGGTVPSLQEGLPAGGSLARPLPSGEDQARGGLPLNGEERSSLPPPTWGLNQCLAFLGLPEPMSQP